MDTNLINECEITPYRDGDIGVNSQYNAVRIKHIPTGLIEYGTVNDSAKSQNSRLKIALNRLETRINALK